MSLTSTRGAARPRATLALLAALAAVLASHAGGAGADSSETVLIRGYVLDPDGQPLARALVSLDWTWEPDVDVGDWDARRATVTTATSGYFEARVLPGSYAFHVTPPEEAADALVTPLVRSCPRSEDAACVRADAEAGPQWLNVTLERGGIVRGRILGPAGEPVAGASVVAYPAGSRAVELDADESTRSGEYRLVVPPGLHEIHVDVMGDALLDDHAGFCDPDSGTDCVSVASGAESWWNVTLDALGAIAGVVRTPDGIPLDGASVHVDGHGGDWDASQSAITGRGGVFRFTVKPGAYSVRVQPMAQVQWDGGGAKPTCRWEGAVACDEPDAPAAEGEAPASPNASEEPPAPPQPMPLGGGSGGWSSSSSHFGRVPVEGLAWHRLPCDDAWPSACLVVEPGRTVTHDVTLAADHAIVGVARDPDGNPLPGARAHARGGTSEGEAVADEEGVYRILVAPGEYDLLVRPPRGHVSPPLTAYELQCREDARATCLAVAGATWQNASLPFGGLVRGVLVDPEGLPVDGAYVDVLGAAGANGADVSYGEFVLALAPGLYAPRAVAPTHSGLAHVSEVCTETGAGCVEVRALETTWWNRSLPAAGRIVGHVSTPARVHAVPLGGGAGGSAFAADDGSFTIEVPPGEYDVVALDTFWPSGGVRGVSRCLAASAACATVAAGGSESVSLEPSTGRLLARDVRHGTWIGPVAVLEDAAGGVLAVVDHAHFLRMDASHATILLDGEPARVVAGDELALIVHPGPLENGEHEIAIRVAIPGGEPEERRVAFTTGGEAPASGSEKAVPGGDSEASPTPTGAPPTVGADEGRARTPAPHALLAVAAAAAVAAVARPARRRDE